VQERLGTQQQSRPVPAASTHLHMSALLSQLGRCVLTVRPHPVLVVVLSGGRHVEALQHAQLAVAKMTMTGDATLPDADDNMLQVLLGTPKRYLTPLSLSVPRSLLCTNRSSGSGALAVAYHNVAVEQEFLRQHERALENYQKSAAPLSIRAVADG
jgi:hypothetical protein